MMEAKDRVIKLKKVATTKTVYPACQVAEAQMVVDQKKMGEQDEISFKAGIREVVEWIRKNTEQSFAGERADVSFYLRFDETEWEAKLKDWGIK